MKYAFVAIIVLMTASLFASSTAPVAFTYQGRLFSSGDPVDGTYTMTFKAFDSVTAGTRIGSTVTISQVPVTNGYFQQSLDFGEIRRGVRIWLEITVKKYNTSETASLLSPRQELTPAPVALYAQKAEALVQDLPMINHVVRLDIEGRGTFYFAQIIDFDFEINKISYNDPETNITHWSPGASFYPKFQLVRYATRDSEFWRWKDELMAGSPAKADCELYVIDTRTGRTIEAWHVVRAFPSQLILESDEEAKFVLEKIRFRSDYMQLRETGGSIEWERPPKPTIVLPVTLTISPSRNEVFESFTNVGWEINTVMDLPFGSHLELKFPLPSFTRASTGSSYIPRFFQDIASGEEWQRRQMTLPLYDSSNELLFEIEMGECWPFEINKTFSASRDTMIETISFAIENNQFSQ